MMGLSSSSGLNLQRKLKDLLYYLICFYVSQGVQSGLHVSFFAQFFSPF